MAASLSPGSASKSSRTPSTSSLERLMRPTSASSARASSARAERRQRETALEKTRHDQGKDKAKGKREKEGEDGERVRYNREAAKEAVKVYPAVTAEELLEKANSSGGGEETVGYTLERAIGLQRVCKEAEAELRKSALSACDRHFRELKHHKKPPTDVVQVGAWLCVLLHPEGADPGSPREGVTLETREWAPVSRCLGQSSTPTQLRSMQGLALLDHPELEGLSRLCRTLDLASLAKVSVAAANMLVIVQMAVAVGNVWAHYASLRAQHRQDLLRAAKALTAADLRELLKTVQEPSACVRQAVSCLALLAAHANQEGMPDVTHWPTLQLQVRRPALAATLQKVSRLSAGVAQSRNEASPTPFYDWSDEKLRAVQEPLATGGTTWAALKRSSVAAFRAVRWLSLLLASAVLSRPQD